MWHDILLGLGMVAVIEGLVLALAPSRLEDLIRAFSQAPLQARRQLGLCVFALGVVIVWIGKKSDISRCSHLAQHFCCEAQRSHDLFLTDLRKMRKST